MRLLFLHGAGGFVDDRSLANELGAATGATVELPQLPDGDMSFESWAVPVREHLQQLAAKDLVVGHSFGASILLRVLAEGAAREGSTTAATTRQQTPVALLAMPDWSAAGWDVEGYAWHGPEPARTISLHH